MLLEKKIDIPTDWYNKLKHYIEAEEFASIGRYIKEKRQTTTVYPYSKEIFNAFRLTPYKDVRVVIIGMDPYPGTYLDKPVACGLSFAPRNTDYVPPSLRKIYDRLKKDFYQDTMTYPVDLDIHYWAKQGVLMLNAALTVEANKSGSHLKLWKNWTDEVIKALNEYSTSVVFCLWGKDAQAFAPSIGSNNIVLTSEHPVAASYQARDWNCDHFQRINEHLLAINGEPIDWIKT